MTGQDYQIIHVKKGKAPASKCEQKVESYYNMQCVITDLHYLYCALFMYDYNYSNKLPSIFNNFFTKYGTNKVHQYQTRLASKILYYLPKARTNYGKFNIRFFGVKVWNSIDDSFKAKSRTCFLKELLISNY